MKISIIGSGDVGAQTAVEIAGRQIADEVVLVDIIDGLPQGRALDIQQYCPTIDSETRVIGTNSYSDTRNSDIVVITAGVARNDKIKSRNDLIETNKKILTSVTNSVVNQSPNAVIIVVTNPVDIMTYHVWKTSGLESKKVLGMAGVLDSARLKVLIAEKAGCMIRDVDAMVIGSHGDDMVPVISHAKIKHRSVTEFLTSGDIDEIVKKTQFASKKIMELTKRSTCYAPAGSIARMLEVIVNDTREILPVSSYLDGEYGHKDFYMGVPAVLGREGVESVIELDLDEKEKELFDKCIKDIKDNIPKLGRPIEKINEPANSVKEETEIDFESQNKHEDNENEEEEQVENANENEDAIRKIQEDMSRIEQDILKSGKKSDSESGEEKTNNPDKSRTENKFSD